MIEIVNLGWTWLLLPILLVVAYLAYRINQEVKKTNELNAIIQQFSSAPDKSEPAIKATLPFGKARPAAKKTPVKAPVKRKTVEKPKTK